MNKYELFLGDCLDIMPTLAAGSVDAVITDPPYGTTACKWDSVIPFEPMWAGIKHARKERGAVVLFGSEPFSSLLRVSNLGEYKYDWVWEKTKPTGHLNCNRIPLKAHENISLFYSSGSTYNPQGLAKKTKPTVSNGNRGKKGNGSSGDVYGYAGKDAIQIYENYPRTVLLFGVDVKAEFHPTQKPVALMEYLIRTYTNPGDTVLDFTMGSGTTGVAAMRTGRNFIGIELDPEYFAIAQERIMNAAGDYVTTKKERATGQTSIFDKLV